MGNPRRTSIAHKSFHAARGPRPGEEHDHVRLSGGGSPRVSRHVKAINKQLKALGATPVEEPTAGHRHTLTPHANEYQIAMSTYQSEDLTMAISLTSMSFALFALVLGTMSGLGYFAGLLVCLIGLLYFLGAGSTFFAGRRAAAAAAAVIEFRGKPETDSARGDASRGPAAPRFSLFSVTLDHGWFPSTPTSSTRRTNGGQERPS